MNNEIVCPYCGYEFSDSWEYERDEEDIGLLECDECGEAFYAVRNIIVEYFTEKAIKGTCKHCKQSNIVIEDYNSTIGKYKDLCLECGAKEKNRLENEHLKRLKE